jgi:hypothetical protein
MRFPGADTLGSRKVERSIGCCHMVASQISAPELFRAAYENRYTWDRNFPGYTAQVSYRDGDRPYQGEVRVGADLKSSVSGIDDEAARKAIEGQLFEVAIHRIRRSFEETHGKNSFHFGKTDAEGRVEILMGGKAEGDRYQLKDNEVVMVHRHIHGVVVTIHTASSWKTGEGYLSHRYDSVYHDPSTGQQQGGHSDFTDEYEHVGNYWLLKRRLIRTQIEDHTNEQEFQFSHFQLL